MHTMATKHPKRRLRDCLLLEGNDFCWTRPRFWVGSFKNWFPCYNYPAMGAKIRAERLLDKAKLQSGGMRPKLKWQKPHGTTTSKSTLIFIWQNKSPCSQCSFIHLSILQRNKCGTHPKYDQFFFIKLLNFGWIAGVKRHPPALILFETMQFCRENSLNLYDLRGGFVEAPGKYLWLFLHILSIPFKS